MFDTKPFWQSKGILGGALAVAGSVLGVAITAGDVNEALQYADEIVTGVAGIIAIWGRISARKAISL